jgi:predicted Zn finger-like uncharacterized protein
MPSIIACPACAGQLRLPDELLGQQVRCPACSNVFTAGQPCNPSTGNGSNHEPEPAAVKPRGLVGAVELNLSLDDEAPRSSLPAPSPEPPLPQPPPRRWDDEDDEREREPSRPRDGDRYSDRFRLREPERRDREPNRGVLILVLGIISLATMVFSLYPLGAILGLVAWVMGHNDLKKIKANQLDSDASGLTKAGWICGIIGTLINSLVTLSCVGFLCFVLLSAPSRPATTYKQPVQFNTKDNANWDKPAPEFPKMERRKGLGPQGPRMKDKNADKDIL